MWTVLRATVIDFAFRLFGFSFENRKGMGRYRGNFEDMDGHK